MAFQDGAGGLRNLSGVIDETSRDKGLDKAIVIQALENAVIAAKLKELQKLSINSSDADLTAEYCEEKDEIELFLWKTVVSDDDIDKDKEFTEITESKAKERDSEIEVGDSQGEKIELSGLGRIAAQSAKQIIVQRIKEAERSQIYNKYKEYEGQILSGQVLRKQGRDIIVDLVSTEARIPASKQIPDELFRVKDRIQGYVEAVVEGGGIQVLMSRSHPNFLKCLFAQNVTEISDEIVIIKSIAREAGSRSKIAVYSTDAAVDPVGACVGQRGARVQAVVQELNNEKIDIVPWESDPAKLVVNALSPALVSKVIMDNERHSMEVVVSEEMLSLAIGRKGQNVRLAAALTGWRLDIKSEKDISVQLAATRAVLKEVPGVGDLTAGVLVDEGIKTPEDLSQTTPAELKKWLNLSPEDAKKVIAAAKEKAEEQINRKVEDTDDYSSEDAHASPEDTSLGIDSLNAEQQMERDNRLKVFRQLKGVGEATATALADAGYGTIGDLVGETRDNIAQQASISRATADTVLRAADRFLQDNRAITREDQE